MNTCYTFPEANKKWPEKWTLIVTGAGKHDGWGDPKPTRSQMNGLNSEGFLRWMNSLLAKGEGDAAKASGDGFWECRVHWRELRIEALRQAKEELEQEQYREKNHKMSRVTVGSAVRPLYPVPFKSALPLNKSIVRASPPGSPPPPPLKDLTPYLIDESEAKEQSPPPSPSDKVFEVKNE